MGTRLTKRGKHIKIIKNDGNVKYPTKVEHKRKKRLEVRKSRFNGCFMIELSNDARFNDPIFYQ